MRLLVDTHALLWWLNDDPLAPEANAAITDPRNKVFVSAASIWEVTIKRTIGKLDFDGSLADAAEASGFTPLPVTATHAEAVGELPELHRDPFDRILVAQAGIESLTIVTRDRMIPEYKVSTLVA